MPPSARGETRRRIILRGIAAVTFFAAGANHFRSPSFYREIVPPMFPSPATLVIVSGIAEMAGGVALLIRPLRRVAAGGLVVLLIAVFPANLYMALSPQRMPDLHVPRWALWVRLPLQAVLIGWVWYAGGPRRTDHKTSSVGEGV